MVKPLSQAAFIADLKSVVRAITLPNGYVMTSNWSWIYKQILLIIHKIKDVLDVLNSNQPHDVSYVPRSSLNSNSKDSRVFKKRQHTVLYLVLSNETKEDQMLTATSLNPTI